MPPTEGLFLAAGVLTAIAAGLAFLFKSWWARILFVVIVVGIPFWELPYGYFNFARLCRDQAKVNVLATFAPQEKICFMFWDGQLADLFLQAGFVQVEIVKQHRVPIPADRTGIVPVDLNEITSPYCIRYVPNVRLPWRVYRHDVLVIGSRDQKPVARQSSFSWLGMYWQEAARLGVGGMCAGEPYEFIRWTRMGSV